MDIGDVEATIVDFCQQYSGVQEIVFDPFRWARTMQVLDDAGFPVVEFPQSPSRMIKACAKFYDAVVEHRIEHDGNPTLARHLDNAVLKMTLLVKIRLRTVFISMVRRLLLVRLLTLPFSWRGGKRLPIWITGCLKRGGLLILVLAIS